MEDFVENPGLVEIGQRIFFYLDNLSLCRSRLVCKSWRDFITDTGASRIFWIRILKRNWEKSHHWVHVNKDWKQIFQEIYYKADKNKIKRFVEIYQKYFPVEDTLWSRGPSYGVSPLHQAVYTGDIESIRYVCVF